MDAELIAVELKEVAVAEPAGLAFVVGFFFGFRIFVVFVAARIFGADPRTGAEANLVLDFLLLLLVCFQSFGNAIRSFRSMLGLPAIFLVLAFLLNSGSSLAWSITVSLPTSLAYWCGLVSDVAAVALLFRAGSVSAVSNALMRGFVVSACCIAVIAWILPADPTDLRLGDEEFFNTNQIGNLCAFAILLAQCLQRRQQGRWGWTIFFLAVTLLRSLSKSTLAAFLVSEAVLLVRDKTISRKTKLYLATAALAVMGTFWGLFQAYYDIYTSTGNQAETFTGRTAIWAYALDAGIAQPWIGHGFDSMWKVAPPFGPDRFEARHAENELLQQFYSYGVVGVLMLGAIYGSLLLQFRRLPRGPLRLIFFSILLYVIIRGFAEAEPFDLLLPLWSIILLSLLAEEARDAGAATALIHSSTSDQELRTSVTGMMPAQTPSKA
jgi:exopolysaccharide production protein ExoQ